MSVTTIGEMPQGSLLMFGSYSVDPKPEYAEPIIWRKIGRLSRFISEYVLEWLSMDVPETDSEFSRTALFAFLNGSGATPSGNFYNHYEFLHCFTDLERASILEAGCMGKVELPCSVDFTLYEVKNRCCPTVDLIPIYKERTGQPVVESTPISYWLSDQRTTNTFSYMPANGARLDRAFNRQDFRGVRPICSIKPDTPVVSIGLNIYAVEEPKPVSTDSELYEFLGLK